MQKELRIVVKSPGLGVSSASMLFRYYNICMCAALSSHYGATAGAAESVTAQLHSQSKLTTPRHENREIRHENELLKAKEPTPGV
jgi:hypothetical protein